MDVPQDSSHELQHYSLLLNLLHLLLLHLLRFGQFVLISANCILIAKFCGTFVQLKRALPSGADIRRQNGT
ncbi:MAG: hypothetical protein WAV38_14630 [Xanthobacteraceae bacterium]